MPLPPPRRAGRLHGKTPASLPGPAQCATFAARFIEIELFTKRPLVWADSCQPLLNLSHRVTKAEIIAEISVKTGLEKADVTTAVEAFFTVVKDSMVEGNNIYVRGFGSFVNKKRARKVARNISQNTSLIIDEHFIPSFKPAKSFAKAIKASDKIVESAEKMPVE